MKAESAVVGVAGVFFGLIVGWTLGIQHTTASQPAAPAAAAVQPAGAPPAKTIDEQRVTSLRADAQSDPKNVQARVELGNLYYDADRFDEAVKWYEEAMKLNPGDPNVSTDLGMCYFYLNQADRALQQFDHTLSVDPKHTKTLLSQGYVRAFGKQDLEGATASWSKLIEIAPNSPEGQQAKKLLDGLKSAHPGGTAPASTPRNQ